MTNPATTTQVVHLDFISLADNIAESAIQDLIQEASALNHLESVQLVGLIRAKPDSAGIRSPLSRGGAAPTSLEDAPSSGETPDSPPHSDFDLAFFFVLDGFTSLEPFGTHSAYIRFLQGKAARILKGFAGADVALTAPFPEPANYAACLALMAPDQAYDWEVRAALESWAAASDPDRPKPAPSVASGALPTTAIGLAIGERQRYRGCVLSFTSHESNSSPITTRPFVSSLITGRVQRL